MNGTIVRCLALRIQWQCIISVSFSSRLVSASFPFNKFGLILEYGGSYGSSRVSTLSPNLSGLPCLHFLKVELENSSASRALCEGVNMPQKIEVGEESHSIPTLNENRSAQQLLEVLNFVPLEDRYYIRSGEAAEVEVCCMPPPVPSSQLARDSEQIQQCIMSYPDTVIIVNTQNIDREMIVSRRSTYQRILAMEKGGIQVVERDSNLPVDIIISSAICLIWYDSGNIGKKSTASDEASSCLPLCVENIATNVLTLLSFTFSACILVFEGEINFISTVMESSDELYAAAASLGLDLQLFYSYSSELTEEIILNCIGYPIKLTRGLYPKMPESETLAESFLTKFPSVNPLTAHAMLSSIGTLTEFLQLSHERRISAIQKYYVPNESINLFSILCKYGERDDSKSIMTDCSSSVSSGPDSDKCHLNIDSERKQRKCTSNPDKIDIHMDNFHLEPLNQFSDSIFDTSGAPKPHDSWKDNEISGDYAKPGSSLNDLFDSKLDLDFDMKMKPSRVSKVSDYQILEGPQILNEINDPNFSLKDILLDQNQASEIARMNNLDWQRISKSSNLQEDFIGEVINFTCSPVSGKEFYSVSKSSSFRSVPEMENNSLGKSKIARRFSFGKSSHPTFPTATEVDSGSCVFSGKDLKQSLRGTNDHPDTDYKRGKLPLEHRRNLLEEVSERRFADSKEVPFQEEMAHYSGTPLSNAIHSANAKPGSPWTMEFLNRIREKSRLRQHSLPCDTAAPCFGVSGNTSKVTKRRSPSILEFFKYQGGSTPRNLPEQKKQKLSIQSSSSSKNKMPSTSCLPIWTPIDKRARQTLAFATNKSGSQTKLVWSDGSAHDPRKKFRSQ
ncbi:hypothetical protein Pint_17440 [Pistacia integerrima]|uniref:Uncharacterized protein n=1 Tax=Pistacia integerrima TaxID=434235 RepID=A0ACC0YTE7_9ROSI|nr:hypothetical protein Pint_17440 [Pistacia integerrima]